MDRQIQSVTVAVVAICGAAHLARCLEGLAVQEDAPSFDIVVIYDPHLTDIPRLRNSYPHVRMIANQGQHSPLELASRAIQEAPGELVLLTEDHCTPCRDWVKQLCENQTAEYAAVGGCVETDEGVSPVDWAFFYVDFFRYLRPFCAGPSPSLTVCNVSYRRVYLEAIRPLWATFFHETAINDALRERFGPLWITPHAKVRMRRHVQLIDAIYERYAFGRLFGCTRLEFSSRGRRLYYAVLAPTLPILLLGRMLWKALAHRRIMSMFLRSLPVLIILVLAWSWGEWLGYLTNRRPGSLVAAPEFQD